MATHEMVFLFLSNLCILSICTQAPSQVTGVSLSKAVRQGRPSLRVTWTALQSDVTISRYQVQLRLSGTAMWGYQAIAAHPANYTILPALDPGTEYNVRVRAVSAAGEGEWSEVQSERTFNGEHQVSICYIFLSMTC